MAGVEGLPGSRTLLMWQERAQADTRRGRGGDIQSLLWLLGLHLNALLQRLGQDQQKRKESAELGCTGHINSCRGEGTHTGR